MRAPTIFTLGRWASVASVVLLGAAMAVYPGGTVRNPSTRGYLLLQNFLSDLGNTVAFGGQPNYRSAFLSMAGSALLALAFFGCSVGFVRLYSSSLNHRYVAHAAGAAGVLACVGLVAATVTPGNRSLILHVRFAQLAFGASAIASLLFAITTARDDRFPAGVPAAWLALTLVLAALFAVGRWGPGLTTDYGLTFHVVAQKIVASAVWAIFIYQTYEADRVARVERAAV